MPDASARARYYAQNNERKRSARASARRRQAVAMLQITEGTVRCAASQLANGAGPEEARRTALSVAAELVSVADALRRLTRLDGPARRQLARQLHSLGMPTKQIAARVGVSDRSVRSYVRGR